MFRFPSDRRFDVVGIGRNSWDRICLVDRYPPADSKVDATAVDNQPGGQVATTLVAVVRLGATARYLGKFGDDAAGRAVRGALAHEGIDLTECKVVAGVSNQVSFVVVDRTQKTRTVFSHCDERLRLNSDDFPEDSVKTGKIAFLGGRLPADVAPFARTAREGGSVVATDADGMADGTEELLRLSDIVFCPADFPRVFSGRKSLPAALRQMAGLGPRIVCCTRGERGAAIWADGKVFEEKPPGVEVVDTTGAGDVFQGAFLVALLGKMSVDRAAKFASAAAALKCTALGGQRGIPTRKQLERFLSG